MAHSSDRSTAKAVTKLRHASGFGKILTTLVRRFISWLRRSRPFVMRMRLRWFYGELRQVRHSSMCSATFSLPLFFLRHFSAPLEAIRRACSLAGAAKIAL